jgi:hypothetical protein
VAITIGKRAQVQPIGQQQRTLFFILNAAIQTRFAPRYLVAIQHRAKERRDAPAVGVGCTARGKRKLAR